jgi:hypothetical protein
MTYSPGMVCTRGYEHLITNLRNDLQICNPLGILDRAGLQSKSAEDWPRLRPTTRIWRRQQE